MAGGKNAARCVLTEPTRHFFVLGNVAPTWLSKKLEMAGLSKVSRSPLKVPSDT
jgi:hypothetical protein